MAIFNPNRTEGGTIKLVKDANGNYTTQEVGFNTLASLSIPDFKTTATTTTTDTKTATDNTGDTITSQTQMAFKMPGDGDDNRVDTTGDMLQESAKKLSDSLQNVSTPTTIQDSMVRSDRLTAEQAAPQENILDVPEVKSPTERVFRSETDRFKQEFDPTRVDSTLAVDRDLKGSAAVQRGEIEPPGFNFDFLKGDRFKQGTAFARPKEGTIDQMAANAMTRQEMISGATPDDPTANQLGVTTAKPTDTALDMNRFKDVSKMGTLADKDVKDVKPVKKSALETVSTSLKSAFQNIKTPTMMVLDAIVGEPTAVQNHAKQYFTDRGDGRIGGNPATDLYAGMNRVSAFGNLEKAGEKRISIREKTIEKKGYGPGDKFYDDTQKMKDQQSNYKSSLDKNVTTKREAAIANQAGAGGDTSGRSGGKIVCTMMNESYGFGSFRNKIWMKFHGNIAPEYQKGYHRIFLPLVNYAKQKGITNKIIKNILEHIAVHSTIDMRQTLRGKKHTLGRLYRKIILPLCYWAGKK